MAGFDRSLRLLFSALLLASAAAAQSYSVQDANKLIAAKDWAKLQEYAKGWTTAEPKNAIAWFDLGKAYAVGLDDPAGASPAYERAVELNPQWAEAWDALGCTYALRKRFADAIAAFQKAVGADGQKPAYWNHLQAAYAESGNAAEAKETLVRGMEASGPYATAHDWYAYANAYAKLGDRARAIQLYDQAVAMNTHFAEAFNNRGAVEQEDGRWRSAMDDYQSAASLGDDLGAKNAPELRGIVETLRQQRLIGPKALESNHAIQKSQARSYLDAHPATIHTEPIFALAAPAR